MLNLSPTPRFWSACVTGVLSLTLSAGAQSFIQSAAETLPDAPIPAVQSSSTAEKPLNREAQEPVTLKRLPLRFLTDEAQIFTSPARIRKQDLKWLLPLGAATAATLSTDTYTMRHVVSRDPSFNDAASLTSDILRGAAIGVPVLMYTAGLATSNEESREAGLLGGEAMIDAYIFDEVIKYATLRERPKQDNADGKFFAGSASSDPSFISGHSVVAWSSAAVLAEEYHRPWEQVGIYTLASGVSLSRVLGQDHFPTDTLLGSAAGWLIGHYVYRAHHRPKSHLKNQR